MDHVAARYPGKELHVIFDNLSTHSGKDVDKWLAMHPDIKFHFTPTGSSWLNQVEIWFGIISRQAIRRGTFGSVRQLINTITEYIASWNDDAIPFEWVATADGLGYNYGQYLAPRVNSALDQLRLKLSQVNDLKLKRRGKE